MPDQDAACATQERGQGEGDVEDPVGVDPHGARRLVVLRRRAHRAPDLGALDEELESDDEQDDDAQNDDLEQRDL